MTKFKNLYSINIKEMHKLIIKNLFGTLNIYENIKIKLIIINTINLFWPISDKFEKLIAMLLVKKNMKKVDSKIEDKFLTWILFT